MVAFMGERRARLTIRRRVQSGVMFALAAHGAALFAATALAVAAPAPVLPMAQPPAATTAVAEPPIGEPATAPDPSAAGAIAEPIADLAADVENAPAATALPEVQAEPPAQRLPALADPSPVPDVPPPTQTPSSAAADAAAPPADPTAAAVTAPQAPPIASPGFARLRAAAPDAEPTPPVPDLAPVPPAPDAAPVPGCAIDLILGTASIVGTPGDDVLTGTPGNDFICGLGGNDTIDGGPGDDTIDGGDGDDTIEGGDGDDCIEGGIGADRLLGDAGNDRLEDDGEVAGDVLLGGGGIDHGVPHLDDEQPGEPEAWAETMLGTSARTCSFVFSSPAPAAGLPLTGGGGSLVGGIVSGLANKARQVVDRVAGLALAESAVASPRNDPFGLSPLERPLPVGEDGVARVWVTCGTSFAASRGSVTLRTMPRDRKRSKPRRLGDRAAFTCSRERRRPVVEIELPVKDRALVKQLGRLRVRATAVATNDAGATTRAHSHFTLVPERP